MRVREEQHPQEGQFCLLGNLCPRGLHAQHLPWDSLACWRGPGSGHISWGTQVSSPGRAQLTALGKTDRVRATSHQEVSTSAWRAQATAVGKWILRRGSLLTKGQEGPIQDKGGTAHQQEVPGWRTFSAQGYQALGTRQLHVWGIYKTPPVMVEKRWCPSWNKRVGRF